MPGMHVSVARTSAPACCELPKITSCIALQLEQATLDLSYIINVIQGLGSGWGLQDVGDMWTSVKYLITPVNIYDLRYILSGFYCTYHLSWALFDYSRIICSESTWPLIEELIEEDDWWKKFQLSMMGSAFNNALDRRRRRRRRIILKEKSLCLMSLALIPDNKMERQHSSCYKFYSVKNNLEVGTELGYF